jgi:PAS domain-containing protein
MPIEARNRPLPDWFTRIRTRQTVLPRFQRFEAWGFGNVVQLFNTILQDLPVGALLVLEIGDEEPFVSRAIIGAPTSGERVSEHLLDGQAQRESEDKLRLLLDSAAEAIYGIDLEYR